MDDPFDHDADKLISESDPPDVMNDPAFAPPQRRGTASSKYGSEGGFGSDTCRICRSEGTPDEPLFYPCKCSGSIKFVHQECLMEWLSHSHKKHCELCKTPFRFTKLYDANMPKKLPWTVFVRRACIHVAVLCVQAFRALLVSSVWLIVLPYMIRWAWRWMFWFADAGWAREAFMRKMQADNETLNLAADTSLVNGMSVTDSLVTAWEQVWHGQIGSAEGQQTETTVDMITGLLNNAFNVTATTNDGQNGTDIWPHPDISILSSWTYISEMTSSPQINRVILDVFEGQLITCVVITGFILVFLIREWVVQQQPLVNIDNLNHDQRERERLLRDRERLVRQAELLDQARARLATLQAEAEALEPGNNNAEGAQDQATFQGWEHMSSLIDYANESLRSGDAEARGDFERTVGEVMAQIRVSNSAENNAAEVAEHVYSKLAELTDQEREAWEEMFVSELREVGSPKDLEAIGQDVSSSGEESAGSRRPPMPTRDTISRATQIQRLLEEADIGLSSDGQQGTGTQASGSTAVEPATESASIVSEPSTEGSWLQINSPEDTVEEADYRDIFQDNNDEMPITNAGPDAKINIKQTGKKKTKPIVPEPDSELKLLSDDQLLKRLKAGEGNSGVNTQNTASTAQASGQPPAQNDNPFHPDGPDPNPRGTNSEREAQDSTSGEQHISTAATEATEPPQIGIAPSATANTEAAPAEPVHNQPQPAPPNTWRKIADWFWGDIEAPGAPEPAIDPNEELIGDADNAQEAPFVPIQGGQPAIADEPDQEAEQENDPEVVAAAQQAGLDAEALEDAEDLEGVLELIGFQGPLIGLFQTSCFCSVLVTGTIFGAVGLPYVWGKLVLSFVGAPITFLIKTPLQVASFVADLLIDLTLLVVGWMTFVIGLGIGVILSAFTTWAPTYRDSDVFQWVTRFVRSTAANAGHRLQNMFLTEAPAESPVMPGWNWAFLSASVHAHASLKNLELEVNAVLNYTGHMITTLVESISSGSTGVWWEQFVDMLSLVPAVPAKLLASFKAFQEYTRPLLDIVGSLKNGTLVLPSEHVPMDPSLVYWSTNDRGLALLAGYLALAAIAAVYVAADTPITRSQSGQKTEKIIRDSLRQAGGVFKVILIISIEMLVFPLYCGLLLDMAFLPLFKGASVATRWAFAVRSPYTFCFVHWFVGTCYMFHFALFVGMCRKILRKGVLWFIRDPDDPTFHPVRDVLERNVTTQLRKIAFSALVYGALVILCLGGVIWSIGRVFHGIFPIYWISTEPVLEFPLDLFLYNLVVPLSIKLFNSAKVINTMYAWWLRRCARGLRLSHFLFDDRQKDEEGTHVHKSWSSFLLMKKSDPEDINSPADKHEGEETPEVYFKKDGKYVLTPCNDQYRPPKPGEAFLHADEDDVYIADKDGRKNDHFAKVYVPPFFRVRVTLFMVCLWMFSAFAGLCSTLVPLVFGRYVLDSLLPAGVKINDIYAYSTGAYVLGGSLYIAFMGKAGRDYVIEKVQGVDLPAWIDKTRRYGIRALKCAYVYGFAVTFVPTLFVLLLQLYLVTPLHTYMHSSFSPILEGVVTNATGLNITLSAPVNGTANTTFFPAPNGNHTATFSDIKVAEHNIHALSDGALALLFANLARSFIMAPGSRGAEAVRRVFADGYFNPNVRLATRFFILPLTLISAVLLLLPLGVAELLIRSINFFLASGAVEQELETLIFRFSYPITAGLVAVTVGSKELSRATGRWRSRIRDEVYLVGERLHNFGEKKPPVGSRSVVRKER